MKKIYFQAYRFSEDLDFTLQDNNITRAQLLDWFEKAFETVRQAANIPLSISEAGHQASMVPIDDGSINFYINYRGPLGGQDNSKQIKVDITRNERLLFEPLKKQAIIIYTDLEPYYLQCYSLEEVLIEKMRSVMQRMQPRDFYDIWYLLEVEGIEVEFLMNEFQIKCESKRIIHTEFPQKLNARLPQYKARWQKSMTDQIKDLPDFDRVVREVQRHFKRMKL